jgi:hypothetical protein
MAKKAEADNGSMTKADAVRAAVKEGKLKPQDGCAWIKEKFGIDITPAHFSSYKSSEAKKAGTPGRRGRRPHEVGTPASNGTPVAPGGAVDLAKQLKSLVTRYGADEVSGMLAVLRD